MKNFNILVVFLLLFVVVKGQETKQNDNNGLDLMEGYQSFGEKIDANESLSSQDMAQKFDMMAVTDTSRTKFMATVTDVCQAKGCWMKVRMTDGKQAMVKFKDYGFFMPKDIRGKEVIVKGKAYMEAMSVEDQKHFAKDAGKSEAFIAKITESKKTYSFEADGVLLKD